MYTGLIRNMKKICIYMILTVFGLIISSMYFVLMTFLSSKICYTIEQANMMDIVIILLYLFVYFPFVLVVVLSAEEPPQAVNDAAIKAAVNASTYFFIMLSPLSALLNHAYVCININSVTFYIIDTFFIFARGNF